MKRTILAAAFAVSLIAGAASAQRTINAGDGVPVGGGRTAGGSGGAATKPGKSSTSKPGKPKKYAVPSEQEVRQAQELMEGTFQKALAEVNPNLHKVESAHFIVFSGIIGPAPSKPGAPPTGVDKSIADTMERMYKALCKQYDIAEDETVWVGKCGIFLLTMPDRRSPNIPDKQFFNFATKVDGLSEKVANGAAGYFRSSALQSYIVMKPSPEDKWDLDYWKSTLIHESTHAFLWRYVSNNQVPLWLNEGIAETSAATIMESKALAIRLKDANKMALKGGKDNEIMSVFKTVGLGQFDYGIAQSWVRFLLTKDHKAFIKFVTLCKEGKDDQEAMQETFKLTREEFLKAWAGWVRTGR